MQFSFIPPPPARSNTRLDRTPSNIPVNLIRYTNEVHAPSRSKIPLLVIQHKDYYYVIDGNHRLAYLKKYGVTETPAWILTEQDKELVEGKTTACIDKWLNGEWTFDQLVSCAVAAYDSLSQSNPEYA
jgi:hypothetical protein